MLRSALASLAVLALPLAAGIWILIESAEARGVTLEALRAMFGFFTTPFVLEASLAIGSLLAVLTWNEYRRNRDDADEWVTLSVPEEKVSGSERKES
jgi:hypothetical protein